MNYEVMKPFNTVTRRLGVGSEISTEEPIEPFTFEERLKSGFIKEPEPELVAAASNDLIKAPSAPVAKPTAPDIAEK